MARFASGSAAVDCFDLPGAALVERGGVSPGGGTVDSWGAAVIPVKVSISAPNAPASGAADASTAGGVPPAGDVAFGPT
jgi:hypothetical protein